MLEVVEDASLLKRLITPRGEVFSGTCCPGCPSFFPAVLLLLFLTLIDTVNQKLNPPLFWCDVVVPFRKIATASSECLKQQEFLTAEGFFNLGFFVGLL